MNLHFMRTLPPHFRTPPHTIYVIKDYKTTRWNDNTVISHNMTWLKHP